MKLLVCKISCHDQNIFYPILMVETSSHGSSQNIKRLKKTNKCLQKLETKIENELHKIKYYLQLH